MNAPKHIGASLAFAIGLALLGQEDVHAADPEKVLVLRPSRGLTPAGRPAAIAADALPSHPNEAPASRAARLLALNRRAFGIADATVEFEGGEVAIAPGGLHVRFTQNYRGIEVHGGELVLSMDRHGSLTMVADAHVPDISLNRITPDLTYAEALNRAAAALGASPRPIGSPDRTDLVIARGEDGTDRLVYRVGMTREQPAGDWEILVDALTGDIRRVEDRFVQHTGEAYVQGEGMAYLSDPLSAAKAWYGSPGFIDGEDADTESLRASRSAVVLDSLLLENGVASLRGPFCSVADIEAPYDSVEYAQAFPYRFDYNRSQPGFEAVMVYYHAVQSLLRFESLGFSLRRLRSLRLDPHGFQGKDNSHYSPSGNWIGFGTGGVDDAEDADVIWHEYGHAIHYTIVPGWGGGECAALGEGYGDYWAASYTRSLGQWNSGDPQYSWMFKWDGHNEFWSGRLLNDDRTYPFTGLTPHMAGQIWASSLLDIHAELGRDVTDRIVLKSLYYLSNGITARDAAYALLQADIDLYDGAHLATLRRVLGEERRFLAPESGSTILILSDEGSEGSPGSASPGSGSGAAGILGSITVPAGYTLRVAAWDSLDMRALFDAAVTVVLSGENDDPLKDASRRRALMDFAGAGGRLLLEGSGVASRMLCADVEPEFASEILGIGGLAGPFVCNMLTGTTDRLFTAPHPLPPVLTFQSQTDTSSRWGVTPLPGTPQVAAAALWNEGDHSAGIILRSSPQGALRSIFFSFAIATMADSSAGRALVENALQELLTSETPTPVGHDGSVRPEIAHLRQNYPNPFNPSTRIRFVLTSPQRAVVKVFDLLGREVAVLMDDALPAGTHEVEWNAMGMPSGVYLGQLAVGGTVHTRRMIFMK